FRSDLNGQRIAGKVEGHKLQPYDDRAAIAQGSLAGRARPLLWTDDPVEAFFLEIQGSGRVRLADGTRLRIGYDAQNGKPYVPIGRVLAEEGEIEKPVTMAKIRAWLHAHPERAQAMMNRNPSVVFFRCVEGDGPKGAQGVVLTPGRSLAVDTAFVPLGVPLWLDPKEDASGEVIRPRLVVAQDTGGAIKGPVRGDLFWGSSPGAEARAGAMQSRGTYYLLLPKTVVPDAARR
ncbi:MAG: MltA domain-containing protein, partial [Alphaproteobacteria bacterium]|nr:MltA domain-containing protein [Alphaproteobacteria bacterium]